MRGGLHLGRHGDEPDAVLDVLDRGLDGEHLLVAELSQRLGHPSFRAFTRDVARDADGGVDLLTQLVWHLDLRNRGFGQRGELLGQALVLVDEALDGRAVGPSAVHVRVVVLIILGIAVADEFLRRPKAARVEPRRVAHVRGMPAGCGGGAVKLAKRGLSRMLGRTRGANRRRRHASDAMYGDDERRRRGCRGGDGSGDGGHGGGRRPVKC